MPPIFIGGIFIGETYLRFAPGLRWVRSYSRRFKNMVATETVMIETNAGTGAGFTDADYVAAGAKIIGTAAEIFAAADMITGLSAAYAMSTALYQRTHTGRGQFVDVAMLDLVTRLGGGPTVRPTYDLIDRGDGRVTLMFAATIDVVGLNTHAETMAKPTPR